MLEVETFGVDEGVRTAVQQLVGVRSVSVDEHGHSQVLIVQVETGVEVAPQVLGLLAGTRVGRVVTRQPTLEDAYVELVSGE